MILVHVNFQAGFSNSFSFRFRHDLDVTIPAKRLGHSEIAGGVFLHGVKDYRYFLRHD